VIDAINQLKISHTKDFNFDIFLVHLVCPFLTLHGREQLELASKGLILCSLEKSVIQIWSDIKVTKLLNLMSTLLVCHL